jgi:hypothetical protein
MGRSALLVAAGFVLGVTATLLWRGRPPVANKTPAPPAIVIRESDPDHEQASPETPVGASAAPQKPALPDMPKPERVIIPDYSNTKFGRPPKPKYDDLVKAENWDEFYKACSDRGIRGELFEDLIFQRLAGELGLDTESTATLKKLFQAEQQAATKAIIDAAGGIANFERRQDEQGFNWNTLAPEWNRQRSAVRDSFNGEYLKVLTYDKLNVFNDHLRNSEIDISNSYSDKGTYHLIGGVGKRPK